MKQTDRKDRNNLWEWIALGILISFNFVLAFFRIQNADIWMHLAAGKYFWAQGLPVGDVFSATRFGMPWIKQDWLFEFIIYPLWQLGGATLLVWFKSFILVLTTVILWRLLRFSELILPWRLGLALTGSWLAATRYFARPEFFTFFFLAVLLWLLFAPTKSTKQRWYYLPPLFLLWANIHIGFLVGLAILITYLVGKIWDERKSLTGIKSLLTYSILSVVVTLINPSFYQLYLFPFLGIGRSDFSETIDEFRPPFDSEFTTSGFFPVYLLILVILIITLLFNWRKARLSVVLPVLALSVASFLAMRNVAIFGITVPALIALTWQEKINPTKLTPKFIAIAFLIGIAGLGIAASSYFGGPEPVRYDHRMWGASLRPHVYPEAAIDFIKQNHLPEQLFNDQAFGNYIAWVGDGEYLPYIDGRLEVYGAEFYTDYLNLIFPQPGFNPSQELERRGVNLIITRHLNVRSDKPNPQNVNVFLTQSNVWALVFWDDLALVWVRRQVADPDWLARNEYRYFQPIRDSGGIIAESDKVSALVELERSRALSSQDNASATIMAAQLLWHSSHVKDAIIMLEDLITTRPEIKTAHALLGMIYLQENNPALAEKELKEAGDARGARLALGKLLLSRGEGSAAVTELLRAVRSHPEDGETHLWLAEAWGQSGNLSRGLEEAKRADDLGLVVPNSEKAVKGESIIDWLRAEWLILQSYL